VSFNLQRGTAPLVISMPHIGAEIPELMRGAYVPRAIAVEDADWHLGRFYDFAAALGASVLQPRYSRYVIDLNRPPDDAPMYPGASNTELCPTRFFMGDPLYNEGKAPSSQQRIARRDQYWQPYHDALTSELARVKGEHGFVLLWDAHSIRSEIPWLFDGRLPDLNIGTADGASADSSIGNAVVAAAAKDKSVSHVLNGRFKGGYITRHYGRPQDKVHAVQLEMCQCIYMQEVPPYAYEEKLAARVQPLVESMVAAALAATRSLYGR
jgi:N-formylglutamate deformylase